MRKLRIFIISVLVVLSMCSFTLFAACKDDSNNNTTNLSTIKLDQTVLLMEIGESKTLTATSSDSGATFSWISFDNEIVSVENGTITALKEGTTTVVVYIDDVRAYCTITVKDGKDANVTLAPDGTLSYKKAETEKVNIDLYDGATKLINLATDYTAATLNIHDLIVDYRVKNSVTEDKAYTVKIKGSKVEGEIKTGTYKAIDTLEKLLAAIAAANQAKPDYMYLTADIVIEDTTPASDNRTGGLFMLSGVETMPAFLNIDGQGHSISYGEKFLTSINNGNQDEDNGETEDDCRTLFGTLKQSKIKNLVIDIAIAVEHASTGLISFYTEDVDFTDCYFKVALNQQGGSYSNSLFKGSKQTNFTNCVFELIDINENDSYDVHITGHESSDTTFTDCATIYSGNESSVTEITNIISQQKDSDSIAITNFNLYYSVKELILTEKDDNTWSSAWTFDGENNVIKLLDIVRASSNVDVILDKNGLLDFAGMTGERTVIVNDGTADVITETLPETAENFDLYDAIISYRETNSITEDKSYTANVSIASYSGSVTTATIIAIGDTADFRTKVGAASAPENVTLTGNYYYLTQEISFTHDSTNIGGDDGDAVFLQDAKGIKYINLDGRGFKIKANIDRPTGGTRRMLDKLENSYIENVIFEYTANLVHAKNGTLARVITTSTFENCYFKWTTNFTAPTKPTELAMSITASFNNCLFEFVDKCDDAFGMRFSEAGEISLNNCAIINADTSATLDNIIQDENAGEITNSAIYTDVFAFVGAEKNFEQWNSGAWDFDDTSSYLKLKGEKTIYYGKESGFSGTPTVDGIVAFKTGVSGLKIDLYSAESQYIATLEESYAGATYDTYKAISDYRVVNGITTNASYNVKFESVSTADEFTTVTIGSISNLAELKTAVDAQSGKAQADCKVDTTYYYLTNDITFEQGNTTGTGRNLQVMANSNLKNAGSSDLWNHINLDGRGYSFKFTLNSTGAGSRLIFCRLYESNIKNLVVDYSGTFGVINAGSLAYGVQATVFTDCYFKLDINSFAAAANGTHASTGDAALFNFMQATTFNKCVFELIDANTTDSLGMAIQSRTNNCSASKFENCAVVYNKQGVAMTDLFKQTGLSHTITNTVIYSTIQGLVDAEKTDTSWNGELKIIDQGVTLCGKTLATVSAVVA